MNTTTAGAGNNLLNTTIMNSVEMRKKLVLEHAKRRDDLINRLENKRAQIGDIFTSGADAAKLKEMERLANELEQDLQFLERQANNL